MSDTKIRWEETAPGIHYGSLPGKEAPGYYIRKNDDLVYKLYEKIMRQDYCKSYFHSLKTAKEYAEALLGKPVLPDLFGQLGTILTEIKSVTDVLDARDIKDVLIPLQARIEEQISQLQNIWNYAYDLETNPGQYE